MASSRSAACSAVNLAGSEPRQRISSESSAMSSCCSPPLQRRGSPLRHEQFHLTIQQLRVTSEERLPIHLQKIPASEEAGYSEYYRSTARATALPPPRHNAAIPRCTLRRCISYNSVVRIRAPEAPIGCPIAT